MKTVGLLLLSNVFMVYAWYGHLKTMNERPLWIVILVSWGIAFFEYLFQIPANRIGARSFDLIELKVIQETVHLTVFAVFAWLYMKQRLTLNHLASAAFLILAVYFAFRDSASSRG